MLAIFRSASSMNGRIRSIGSGKMVVELFSAAISVTVWRYRSWMALGSVARVRAACASVSEAWSSPCGRDDLGPPFALGLGLAGHRALHPVRQVHVLHFDGRDLDAPRLGPLVDDPLEHGVDLLAVAEQFVELHLAEHGAERRLRQLAGGVEVVLDLDDRARRDPLTFM